MTDEQIEAWNEKAKKTAFCVTIPIWNVWSLP
jgi:hypothetical protein